MNRTLSGNIYNGLLSQLFYLHEVQLYRCSPAKDLYGHFQLLLVFDHFINHAVEVVERTINDLNGFAHNEVFAHG